MSTYANNFWRDLKGSVWALAPMEDVTDTVFREIVLSLSAPENLHLLFTEFTSVDGLCHPVGRQAVLHRLFVNDSERKLLKERNVRLIAQLWGTDPQKFYEAGKYLSTAFDFDGIDINMGCPVDKVVKQGACSALIDQPALAIEIINATAESTALPVSVKTRTGVKTHQTEKWMAHLLQSRVSAITLHGRTQKMQSLYPAEWEQIAIAARVRNSLNPQVKLLGNGDVASLEQASRLVENSGADGAMIGRGIFANPWLFAKNNAEPGAVDRLLVLKKHIQLFSVTWQSCRNFSIMKRFFKIYVHGFAGAVGLRASLMLANQPSEAIKLVDLFLAEHAAG